MNVKTQFKEGLLTKNPVTVQLLGMCSTMAITTMLLNGIGTGMSVPIILTCSNIVISLLRKSSPPELRIACYMVVLAGFVTMVDLLLQAYLPSLSESLGVFIPLIVVNCIILGRAEAFASKNSVGASLLEGIFQGIGYTVALIVMWVVRELLGSGTILGGFSFINNGGGIRVIPEVYPALLVVLPVGGFLTLGCLIALMQYLLRRHSEKKEAEKK